MSPLRIDASSSGTDNPPYASLERRRLAAMVDIMVFPFLFTALFLWAFPLLLDDWMLAWPNAINNASGLNMNARWYWFVLGPGVIYFIIAGVVLAFYSACCHICGLKATPGGWLMRIKVVNHKGANIGFGHAFARQFALRRLTDLLTCLSSARYNPYQQGRNDIAYSTFVIYRGRWILNGALRSEPRPPAKLKISVWLILFFGIGLSIWTGLWGFWATKDWLDAKQTVLLHEHHELVELLTRYYHDHTHEGCPENRDIFHEDAQKQTAESFRYFREVQFTSSRETCMVTAKLHTPWDSTLDGTPMHYGIASNQTPNCDGYFQHVAAACKTSAYQRQRKYKVKRLYSFFE